MMKGEFSSTKPYVWRTSARAKRVRIVVRPGGQVVVTRPQRVPRLIAQAFVWRKEAWIQKAVTKMRRVAPVPSRAKINADYKKRKAQALSFVANRVAEISQQYHVEYAKVIIRNQRSRWGSCSRTGTLSFNYRIIDLPTHLADYIIVHELCHRVHMNHSPAFWALVAKRVPEYLAYRRELRRYAQHGVY